MISPCSMPPQQRLHNVAIYFFVFSLSILWAIAHAHAAGEPNFVKCMEVLLQNPKGPMVGKARAELEAKLRVSIVLPERSASSILFYAGKLPNPELIAEYYQKYRTELYWDQEHEVVILVSKNGLSHKTLNKLVPDGAPLLGGTRYPWGKASRQNSDYYPQLNGLALEEKLLNVSFK